MAVNADTQKPSEVRKVSPLFRAPVDAEGKRYLYADEIDEVRIFRQLPGAGNRSRRVPILPYEFEGEHEDDPTFVINPYETREEEIFQQFGPGEYYIEPIGKDGRMMEGGRVLYFGDHRAGRGRRRRGPEFRGESEPQAHDPGYGYGEGMPPMAQPFAGAMGATMGAAPTQEPLVDQLLKANKELLQQMREQQEKLLAAREGSSQRGRDERDDLVASLREEIAALRAAQRAEMDQKNDDLREKIEELRDLKKEHRNEQEALRDELRVARRTHDEEISRLRRAHEDELRDQKRRLENMTDEDRKRALRDGDQEHERMRKRIAELDAQNSSMRNGYEKQIHDLRNEILNLQRDLVDAEAAGNEPPAPPPPGADGQEFSLKGLAQAMAGPIVAAVGQRIGTAMAGQPNQPAPQGAPAQGVPQQVPPQYAPPAQEIPAPQPQYAAPAPEPASRATFVPSRGPAQRVVRTAPAAAPPPQPAPAAAPQSNATGSVLYTHDSVTVSTYDQGDDGGEGDDASPYEDDAGEPVGVAAGSEPEGGGWETAAQ